MTKSDKTKPILRSMTVWGALLVMLPFLVDAGNGIITALGFAELLATSQEVDDISRGLGAIMALIGRWRASTTLKGVL